MLLEKQFIKIFIFQALTSLFTIMNFYKPTKKISYIPLNVALAITRQESAFDISAVSRAGAKRAYATYAKNCKSYCKKYQS